MIWAICSWNGIFLQSVSARAHVKVFGNLPLNVFEKYRNCTLGLATSLLWPFYLLFDVHQSGGKASDGRQGRASSWNNENEICRLGSRVGWVLSPLVSSFQSGKGDGQRTCRWSSSPVATSAWGVLLKCPRRCLTSRKVADGLVKPKEPSSKPSSHCKKIDWLMLKVKYVSSNNQLILLLLLLTFLSDLVVYKVLCPECYLIWSLYQPVRWFFCFISVLEIRKPKFSVYFDLQKVMKLANRSQVLNSWFLTISQDFSKAPEFPLWEPLLGMHKESKSFLTTYKTDT